MMTEVYIRLTEVQRGTTEVQKAQPNLRRTAEVKEITTEQHICSLKIQCIDNRSKSLVDRSWESPRLKL